MIRFPALSFDLPEWKEVDFRQVRAAEQKLAEVVKSAGARSDAFLEACIRLKRIAQRSGVGDLCLSILEPIDVRACTYLLAQDKDFAYSVPVSKTLLKALLVPRSEERRVGKECRSRCAR